MSDTRNLRLTAFIFAAMVFMGVMIYYIYHMTFDEYNLTMVQHGTIISVLLVACTIIALVAHGLQRIARENPEGMLKMLEKPEEEEE